MVVTSAAAPAPTLRHPTVQDEALEGLELVSFGCRLALKNSILVDALRDYLRFDRERLADRARELFTEVAVQSEESAARMVDEQDTAQTLAGRGRHQHDYRALDVGNLVRREEVYGALATWIRTVIGDPDEMRQVVELARLDAWGEVAELIEQRLQGWTAPSVRVDEPVEVRQARATDAVGVALEELRARRRGAAVLNGEGPEGAVDADSVTASSVMSSALNPAPVLDSASTSRSGRIGRAVRRLWRRTAGRRRPN
ncbi:hypothetical protein [uncultured Amnibacterium sp.]|uniref:hypothetical protein n=1 Tax=uncultured Amnibacterium sp. TaxID=1631851 RepID=UPI0035CAAE73